MKKLPILFTSLTLLGAASVSQAATLGYWRFESSPGFLSDSSGNDHTLTAVGSPTQGSITGTDFPTTIPQTGAANASLAQTSNGNVFSLADPFNVTDFTIEAFFAKNVQTTETQYFVSHWEASGGQRNYAFGISGSNGVNGGPANELFLLLSDDGASTSIINSGLTASLSTDSYSGVSFDQSNQSSGVTFYLQDLTGGSLQSSSAAHAITDLNEPTSTFRIASFSGNSSTSVLQGEIDEVRISDTVLSSSQLLAVPEPSVAALALGGIGSLFLIGRRRRS